MEASRDSSVKLCDPSEIREILASPNTAKIVSQPLVDLTFHVERL
jgi:hypothetical protein